MSLGPRLGCKHLTQPPTGAMPGVRVGIVAPRIPQLIHTSPFRATGHDLGLIRNPGTASSTRRGVFLPTARRPTFRVGFAEASATARRLMIPDLQPEPSATQSRTRYPDDRSGSRRRRMWWDRTTGQQAPGIDARMDAAGTAHTGGIRREATSRENLDEVRGGFGGYMRAVLGGTTTSGRGQRQCPGT